VHPAIKKALCQAAGTERDWLKKVRPYWGHFYHFHVRIGCPAGSAGCKPQAPVPGDDGCGKELDDWFQLLTRKPKPKPPGEPKIVVKPKPKAPITIDDLPAECRTVLATGTDLKLPPPAVAEKHGAGKDAAKKPAAAPVKAQVHAPAKPAPTKAAAAKSADKTKKQ
jgi:penicillin-insensitive murein endopeptidase